MTRETETTTGDTPEPAKTGEEKGFGTMADLIQMGGTAESIEKGLLAMAGKQESGPEAPDGQAQEPGADPQPSEPPTEGAAPDDPQDQGEENGVQKRIDELSAQKNHYKTKVEEQEERIRALEKRIAEGGNEEAQKPAQPQGPFDGIETQEQLREKVEGLEAYEDWAEEQLDRIQAGEIDEAELNGEKYDQGRLSEVRRQAKRLQRQARKESERIAAREKVRGQLSEQYPWAKDPSSQEYKIHQQLLNERFPELKNNPIGELAVADMMIGAAIRAKKGQSGNGNGAAPTPAPAPADNKIDLSGGKASDMLNGGRKKPPPRANPASPAATPRTEPDLVNSRYIETGSPEDLATLLMGEA